MKSLITHGAATTVTALRATSRTRAVVAMAEIGLVRLPGRLGAELLDHHRDEDRREHPPEHQLVEDVGHGVGDVVGVGQAGLGDAEGVDEGRQPSEAGEPGQGRPHRHHRRRPPQAGGQDRHLPVGLGRSRRSRARAVGAHRGEATHGPGGRRPSGGAGDRDRTGIASLEGWSSTIELHPPGREGGFEPPTACPQSRCATTAPLPGLVPTWIRGLELRDTEPVRYRLATHLLCIRLGAPGSASGRDLEPLDPSGRRREAARPLPIRS